MSQPEITDTYIRQLRQQHDAYKTQVAIATAKQQEIIQALQTEFGLTIEAAPQYLEQQMQQVAATESQLVQECNMLDQQLRQALATQPT